MDNLESSPSESSSSSSTESSQSTDHGREFEESEQHFSDNRNIEKLHDIESLQVPSHTPEADLSSVSNASNNKLKKRKKRRVLVKKKKKRVNDVDK